MMFGIGIGDERTLEDTGGQIDLKRERIRQIETKGLKKLRHPVRRAMLKNLTDGFNMELTREMLWKRPKEGSEDKA